MSHREMVTRGRLPHWYVPGAAHFVTYRLADSLPREVLEQLRSRRDQLLNRRPPSRSPALHRYVVHKQLFTTYDTHLDRSRNIRWLTEPGIADMIRENLYHHHGAKYHLLSWCLMSNHMHVLFIPKIAPLPTGLGMSHRRIRGRCEPTLNNHAQPEELHGSSCE